MGTVKVVSLALMCTAFGGVAGSKLALFHQHQELERNKSLVRRMHVEVWSEPNMEKAAKVARELYTSDFVFHDWTGSVQKIGVECLIKRVADGYAVFPDGKEHLEAIVAEGDLVMDRYVSSGTQAGDLDLIPGYSPRLPNRRKHFD